MTFSLRTAAISAITSCFLILPMAVSAHPVTVARADGSVQAAYSIRGQWRFINKVSKRHLRHRVVEVYQPMLLQKEII